MSTIKALKLELASSFDETEIANLPFRTIWQEVQKQHGMDSGRNFKRLKPSYEKAFHSLRKIAAEWIELTEAIRQLNNAYLALGLGSLLKDARAELEAKCNALEKQRAILEHKYRGDL